MAWKMIILVRKKKDITDEQFHKQSVLSLSFTIQDSVGGGATANLMTLPFFTRSAGHKNMPVSSFEGPSSRTRSSLIRRQVGFFSLPVTWLQGFNAEIQNEQEMGS